MSQEGFIFVFKTNNMPINITEMSSMEIATPTKKLPDVIALTCTAGRHAVLERAVRCFIDQDYDGNITLLIYNNSPVNQQLSDIPLKKNRSIHLINNSIDLQTSRPYECVGAIFRDALTFVMDNPKVITHFDDDDIFLPWHISEGVKGYNKALKQKKLAYKPHYSYFWWDGRVELLHNTLEPSFFLDLNFLRRVGYRQSVVDYNQSWTDALRDEDKLLSDRTGKPSFIYDWSGKTGVHKISGSSNDDVNFKEHRECSRDEGDRLITPLSTPEIEYFYNIIADDRKSNN